jgi:hypothetical protein
MITNPTPGSKPGSRPVPKLAASWPPIDPADMPIQILLQRLRGVRQRSPNQWSACCPSHPDSNPSLSITENPDGKVLIYCHADCDATAIMAAIGLKLGHLYVNDYARTMAMLSGPRKIAHANLAAPASRAESVEVSEGQIRNLTRKARMAHQAALKDDLLPALVRQIGVPIAALCDFEVGLEYDTNGRACWLFPERDDRGQIVGLLRRTNGSGKKLCVTGSHRGLSFTLKLTEAALANPAAPLFLPEGHTDTIALHGAGALAIGRPAASLSGAAGHWLQMFLRAAPELWQARPIIVLGDTDYAGAQGAAATARKLSEALGRPVMASFPPDQFKDMREWIATGEFDPAYLLNPVY